MIIKETRYINEDEFDYYFSNYSLQLKDSEGRQYDDVQVNAGTEISLTETETVIEGEQEWTEEEKTAWIEFTKKYTFMFGPDETIYSKYKIVKYFMSNDQWEKVKDKLQETGLKDLFDAAIEFSSFDSFFIKGVFLYLKYTKKDILDVRRILDNCIK